MDPILVEFLTRWDVLLIAALFVSFWWGSGNLWGSLKIAFVAGAFIILVPALIRGTEKLEQRYAKIGPDPDREICTPSPFGCQ